MKYRAIFMSEGMMFSMTFEGDYTPIAKAAVTMAGILGATLLLVELEQ